MQLAGRPVGVAHTLSVDETTGTLVAGVPLLVPVGRNSFSPQLQLDYRSGGSNSVFGVGWRLSGLLTIGVDTTDGLAHYDDRDAFAFTAAGSLAPVADGPSPEAPDRWEDRGTHRVRRFRGRVERGYHRIEQWIEKANGRVHWRTYDARGAITVYGADAAGLSRLADPRDPARIFQWLPEIQFDPFGNAIRFDYAAEDLAGVDRADASEAGRFRAGVPPAQRYLKRIQWANTVRVSAADLQPAAQRWCFEVVFDYGDHDPADPRPAPDRAWSARPDPFSIYTPGFELRTYRLCRRVLIFHNFDALGPSPMLAGAYELEHEQRPEGSRLIRVRHVGVRQDGGVRRSRARPPLTFTYTAPRVADEFRAAPRETLDALPHGLDAPRFRWIDLLGEGLPGILAEHRDAWFYRRNEGGGRFSRELLVSERPAYRLADVQIQDFDGDGNPNLTVVGGRAAGYYEFDRAADQWRGFQPFRSIPHLEAAGGRTQWLDLDGDGRSELLLGEPDRLTWFRSLGREGFDAGIELHPPAPLEPGIAAPLRDHPATRYFFADMNGDGLADQVLVLNGLVAYWPNLGHGRFGAPLLMDGAPWFAPEGEFNPTRLLFVDLDGSGTADLVYLGRGEITYWTNACGNRLLPGTTLRGLPYIDDVASARVLDFLGDGTPCLVWSNPLHGNITSLQYVPLTDGVRAGLIAQTNNGMGLVHRAAYATSAAHYLRDHAAGEPWHTRLASHLTVVDRLETIDEIGGARTVTRYAYHDGAFDARERRFIGFGCVESFDTEETPSSDPSAPVTSGSCTRTFLHLGSEATASLARAWRGDAAAPVVPSEVFESTAPLSDAELLDAMSAVAGQVIRQEIFAMSAAGVRAAHPIRLYQSGFLLRTVQRAGAKRRAVFAPIQREQITAVYEQTPGDARISHQAALETDQYGGTTLSCAIAYPRRAAVAAADPEQRRLFASAERVRAMHVDTAAAYQPLVGVEHETFDLPDLPNPPAGVYTWQELRAIVAAAVAAPLTHDAAAVPAGSARRTDWTRTFYYAADGVTADALASAALPIRVHHVEEAAFSTTFAAAVYAGRADAVRLQSDARYSQDGSHWWRAGETFVYGSPTSFYRLERLTRVDGGTTRFTHDAASLVVVGTEDAVGNRVQITPDYYVLAPARTIDENDNTIQTAYDPLGSPFVVTRQGEVLDDGGTPRLYGSDRLADLAIAPATSAETVLADPAAFLQTAAEAMVYDLDRWTARGEPPLVVHVSRESLRHDGTGGSQPAGRVLVSVTHLDGFGRALQEKHRVEAGNAIARAGDGSLILDGTGNPTVAPAAERWLASGHTAYNARQEPARMYEPFFSNTWRFEPDSELSHFGAVHTFLYDALGRRARHDHPNGTHERSEFGVWSTRTFDTNDTVEESVYRVTRDPLPAAHPERLALEGARAHAGTPVVVHVDPLGRDILRTEASGDGQDRTTRTTYAPDGTVLSVRDARGIESLRVTRDMLERTIRTRTADAGEELVLFDALDQPIESWRDGGAHVVRRFDTMDRLLTVDADGLPGLNRRVQEITYGDDPAVPDAARRNVRGRVFRVRDDAGERAVGRYTPSDDVLEITRRVAADPGAPPDWRALSPTALLPDVFVSRFRYDALHRPIRSALADGAVIDQEFALSGGVRRATISTADGLLSDHLLFDNAEFNARGQRTGIALGNGVSVSHTFDPDTWRTSAILARRGGDNAVLQDLEYTYDPVGNVIRSLDRCHEPGAASLFLTGTTASAERRFRYDSFYRLREATGRVHRALMPNDHRTDPPAIGTFKGARRISLNDGGQLERYTQTFTYDVAGNLTRLRHQGTSVNWTNDFWVSATTNRSLPALDANGIPVVNPESHFDAAGRCVRLPHLRLIAWDHAGMLSRAVIIDRTATGEPNDEELYVHDSDGTRVRKLTRRMVNGGAVETTDVLYLDGCEIKRIDRGAVRLLERRTTHVHDQSNRIATVHRWTVDVNARETADTTRARVHYHLTDHLGSAQLQLDETGQVIAYEEYLPYGNTAFLAGDDVREIETRAYRYASKERDDATGLYYFGYRYYAPWLCRWISPDPAGPVDDLNLYQYALNNPISNFDPDGLQSRGRELTVAGQIPPQVTAAFNTLPEAEKTRLRGLMAQGQFRWFWDRLGTGQIHFGSAAEIQPHVEASLAANRDVYTVVAGNGQANANGGQGGNRSNQRQRSRGQQRGNSNRTQSGRPRGARTGARRGQPRGRTSGDQSPPADGTGGQARGPGGAPGDSSGTGDAGDTGANTVNAGDGSQNDAPPGSPGTGGEGTGGQGTGGNGPGANPNSQGTGTGGGGTGEGPNAIGTGDEGDGPGGGTGTGSGTGPGDQPGESESSAFGRGGDGGGNGDGGGADGGGTGVAGQPGGVPGGQGTDPGGQIGGSPLGQPGGDASGAPGGSANGQPGTGANDGQPGNSPNGGDDPNGPRGGTGSGAGGGQNAQQQRERGRGERPGGERGGGGRQEGTVMDRVVQIAGYWHLEFSGDPNGQSGGIPGGMGSLNLGWFGQSLFLVLTVADIALTIASFGGLAGLKVGLKLAVKGLAAAGRAALRRIGQVFTRNALRRIGQVFTRGFWRGVGQRMLGEGGVRRLLGAGGRGGGRNPFADLAESEIDDALEAMSSKYIFRGPVSATEAGHAVETMVPVSRWGRPGLRPGDWVMPGPPNRSNWILSFKWDPNPTNIRAPFRIGEGYIVPPSHVTRPRGWGLDGWFKSLFQQRRYTP